MNKNALHQSILAALQKVLDTAVHAANQAHETATHSETVAENKYDTFGLEASYLAQGQSKRVLQAEEDVQQFQKLPIKQFDEDTPIHYGALVSLQSLNSDKDTQVVFLSPVAGGLTLEHNGQKIMLVTQHAPLGKVLLGTYLEDEITLGEHHYLIASVS